MVNIVERLASALAMIIRGTLSIAIGTALLSAVLQLGAEAQRQEKGGRRGGAGRPYPAPKSAWEVASIVLGCPTDRSVAVAIRPNADYEAFLEYGLKSAGALAKTERFSLAKGTPTQISLTGLKSDAAYRYRLRYKKSDEGDFATGPEYTFQTQRSPGKSFTFFVQGDSHPERNPKMNVPELYERTLVTAAKEKPDFFICMGDDFSVDTLRDHTPESVEGVYTKQVPYLGLVGNSSPVFLVNGNHEQAAKANLDGTAGSLGVLAQNARNRYFAQPAPDGFYTGNSEKVDHIGLLRNYFAWTWGDATFVVIDPYWHSDVPVDNAADGGSKRRDLWQITIGDKQYQWLKNVLETSKSKYKFVFAHHVLGTGRGGVERAPYFEWGGKSQNGTDEFKQKRPSWALPIHQLMVKNHVNVFFQGHDHIFAKQELDGVVYQTTPVPADTTNQLINGDAYQSGDKVPGAGLVRVTVAPDKVRIEYVRSFLPGDEKDGHKHGEVAYQYELKPREGKQ